MSLYLKIWRYGACVALFYGCASGDTEAGMNGDSYEGPGMDASMTFASFTGGSGSLSDAHAEKTGSGGYRESDAGVPLDGEWGIGPINATVDRDAAIDELLPEEMKACLSQSIQDQSSCQESFCSALRSCCVGNGACCSSVTVEGNPYGVDFLSCDGQDPTSCLTDSGFPVESFGPREPSIHGNAFYPGGDHSGDSGLRFQTPFDLTSHRVIVSARFYRVSACGADCLEGVGIGFVSDDDLPAHLAADVALVYSASLGQVRLLLGGTVVDQASLFESEELWSLELRPSGRLRVYRDSETEPLFEAPFSPQGDSRLLLFGHNQDPSSTSGARLSDLTVDTALCDIPIHWQQRQSVTLLKPDGEEWEPDRVASPSVAYDDEGTAAMVFEVDDSIFFARRTTDDPNTFTLIAGPETPLIDRDAIDDAVALRDPWLMWDGSNWLIYLAVQPELGDPYLANTYMQPDELPLPLSPLVFDQPPGVLDGPTVVAVAIDQWVMVARHTDSASALLVFESYDGSYWFSYPQSGLAAMTGRPLEQGTVVFDRTDIQAPALVIHNNAWQLYYVGHSGTRFAIGLLVSDDLDYFRRVPGRDPILKPTGTVFERHSVFDPSVIFRDQQVELFYVGSDGVRNRIGRTLRAATADGSFVESL